MADTPREIVRPPPPRASWLIPFTRYRWTNAEPWPWRRDLWTRCHPYPTPLWVRLLERRRNLVLLRRASPGFYRRSSPVVRRYHAWCAKRRNEIFAQAAANRRP